MGLIIIDTVRSCRQI